MLQLNNIDLCLTDKKILSGISFFIGAQERVALVGPSGSGKTSLLRLIAGLQRPSAGNLQMQGENVYEVIDRLVAGHPDIALVHQDFQLSHRISVRENIRQKLRDLVWEEQEERLEELLSSCHLLPIAERAVELLSGGEKQRLALARALADAPKLLLFDEPFSNLDPPLKASLKDELLDILDALELACLLVTHEPSEALSLAERVIVLQDGRIMQEGRPQDIYERPNNAEVANLFGRATFLKKELLPAAWQTFLPNTGHVCLRPEHISVTLGATEALLQGTIDFCQYIGPAYLCSVVVPGLPVKFYGYSLAPLAKHTLCGLQLRSEALL